MYDRAGEMASPNQEEGEGTLTGSDPFYDRFHWFKLVGRLVSFLQRQVSTLLFQFINDTGCCFLEVVSKMFCFCWS